MANNKNSNVLTLRTRISRRETRKMAAFGALASIVLIVTMANTSLMSKSQKSQGFSSGGRTIASVENLLESPTNPGWLKSYIQSRAKSSERTVASLGRTPSVLDDLRFGLLEGKYALHVQGGKLKQIEFIETSDDRPKYINDKVAFLEKYREVLNISFSKVVAGDQKPNGDLQEETFQLMSGSSLQGTVKFVSDSAGRLLALQVDAQ